MIKASAHQRQNLILLFKFWKFSYFCYITTDKYQTIDIVEKQTLELYLYCDVLFQMFRCLALKK